MADCRAGKIDYILTMSISRFSRNTTDCIDLVRSLLRLNIPIYFEKENLNTGSMEGDTGAMVTMKPSSAERILKQLPPSLLSELQKKAYREQKQNS